MKVSKEIQGRARGLEYIVIKFSTLPRNFRFTPDTYIKVYSEVAWYLIFFFDFLFLTELHIETTLQGKSKSYISLSLNGEFLQFYTR